MTSIEKTAETVEAAIQAGLAELGVGASDVMVEVLEEPSRGILGVGARPARVRLVLMVSRRETTTYSPMGMPEYNDAAPEVPFRPEDYERYDPSQNRSQRGPRPGAGRGPQRGGDRPNPGQGQGQGNRGGVDRRGYQGPSERATQGRDRNARGYQGPSERAHQAQNEQRDSSLRQDNRPDRGTWTDRRDNRGGGGSNRREGGPRGERSDRPRRDRGETAGFHQYDYEPNDDDIAAPIGQEVADSEADETARVGKELLSQLLEKMQLEGTVTIHRAEPTRESEELHWILNIGGIEMSRLIGRRGETLTAIQYLLRLMISRRLQTHANIIVDAGGYKANRANRLKQLAQRMADQAIAQNRTIVLEPMPPHERRIVHLALRARPDVTTKSIGEGDNRKVTISRKAGSDE